MDSEDFEDFEDFEEFENLEELIKLIIEKDFKIILIQSNNINESIKVCNILQERFINTNKQFFILGDNNYSIDIISSKRFITGAAKIEGPRKILFS
uniref:Uncharacterized protein n=1 Tax=Theileria annulata TaxID=5874 RepID=A0A3B0MXM8_THEAN